MTSTAFQRQLREVTEIAGNHVRVGERWLLNLASNNYLGLANDPRIQQAAIQAIQRWGTGTGSSPLLSGFTSLHQEMARTICGWKTGSARLNTAETHSGSKPAPLPNTAAIRALLFPCGYSANLAAMTVLLEPNAQVFADRKNHASLVDGLRMAKSERPEMSTRYFRHRDFADLERLLEQSDSHRPRWIVTDSVFSMDGTCTRPGDIGALVERYNANVLIDEAHATGVMGSDGAGLFSYASSTNAPGLWSQGRPKFAVVGTFSKALASIGGFFVGPAELVERMIQKARPLIYSTSLNPGSVAAAMAAIQWTIAEPWRRETVQRHSATLHSELTQQGWKTIGDPDAPLLAVVVGDHLAAQQLADALMEVGIWAPAIRPPTVKPQECRVRLSPTATMTPDEIQSVLSAFATVSKKIRNGRVT